MRATSLNNPGPVQNTPARVSFSQQLSVERVSTNIYYFDNTWTEPRGPVSGDPDGELVPLDGSYHQEITNAFRQEWPYGQSPQSPDQLEGIMNRVYGRYPLP